LYQQQQQQQQFTAVATETGLTEITKKIEITSGISRNVCATAATALAIAI
jgi:hypothetical protein